jgi:hypothetical protein
MNIIGELRIIIQDLYRRSDLRNHTIGSQYKNHVFDILKVSDVKMSKRNVLMESVSFYECLLLVKEQRENPDEAF